MRRTLRKSAILRTTVQVAPENGYESLLSQLAMECAVQSLITGSCLFDGMSALAPIAAIKLISYKGAANDPKRTRLTLYYTVRHAALLQDNYQLDAKDEVGTNLLDLRIGS